MLVVGVSMLKEAREDYKRYCQDKEVNERPTRVMDNDTGGLGAGRGGEGGERAAHARYGQRHRWAGGRRGRARGRTVREVQRPG